MSKDLYDTLNVEKTATMDEIKHAFKKEAKKHHPDKDGGDHDSFVALSTAYAILSDSKRRKRYDETGDTETLNPEDDAPKALQEAIEFLLQAIFKGSVDVENIDFIVELKKIVKNHTSGVLKNLNKIKRHKKSLTFVLDRLKLKKKDNADYISVGVKQKLMNIDIEIKQLEHLLFVDKKVLEILKNYSYDSPESVSSIDFRLVFGQTGGINIFSSGA